MGAGNWLPFGGEHKMFYLDCATNMSEEEFEPGEYEGMDFTEALQYEYECDRDLGISAIYSAGEILKGHDIRVQSKDPYSWSGKRDLAWHTPFDRKNNLEPVLEAVWCRASIIEVDYNRLAVVTYATDQEGWGGDLDNLTEAEFWREHGLGRDRFLELAGKQVSALDALLIAVMEDSYNAVHSKVVYRRNGAWMQSLVTEFLTVDRAIKGFRKAVHRPRGPRSVGSQPMALRNRTPAQPAIGW